MYVFLGLLMLLHGQLLGVMCSSCFAEVISENEHHDAFAGFRGQDQSLKNEGEPKIKAELSLK